MKNLLVAAALLAVCATTRAESPTDQPASPEQEHASTPKKDVDMKAREPMKTPMAREGMMMGDVKASAAKKDAMMKDTIRQEETTMPAAPK